MGRHITIQQFNFAAKFSGDTELVCKSVTFKNATLRSVHYGTPEATASQNAASRNAASRNPEPNNVSR